MPEGRSVKDYENAARNALLRAEQCPEDEQQYFLGVAQVNATLAVMAQLDPLADRMN